LQPVSINGMTIKKGKVKVPWKGEKRPKQPLTNNPDSRRRRKKEGRASSVRVHGKCERRKRAVAEGRGRGKKKKKNHNMIANNSSRAMSVLRKTSWVPKKEKRGGGAPTSGDAAFCSPEGEGKKKELCNHITNPTTPGTNRRRPERRKRKKEKTTSMPETPLLFAPARKEQKREWAMPAEICSGRAVKERKTEVIKEKKREREGHEQHHHQQRGGLGRGGTGKRRRRTFINNTICPRHQAHSRRRD